MSSLIALTGATGFIGQFLLTELPRRGYRIRVLLRRPSDMQVQGSSAVIGDLSRPQNMGAALRDVDAVVHSAGLSSEMTGIPENDYRSLNTDATINLASAARKAGVKRFVFLSSIRAQCGPWASEVLTEASEPRPTDAYGRSKLAAERALAELDIDWVALRLVLVYGPGVKGNMAQLIRLARLPYPLPLAGLDARRSLLSLHNLAEAIHSVLAAPGPLRRTLIVADDAPVTVPEMISAMRRGLGRNPLLFSLPAPVLRSSLRLVGRDELYDRLTRSLVVDSSALRRIGWQPSVATLGALAELVRG
ncbi:MAG: NAD-dependent epimerase/dehydratase family protein, partial [Xanthobacteraceae bacterium]|nr:NAD-dependent epimerase/dehydratase family protein [Xanthobacteraceae bacterium]